MTSYIVHQLIDLERLIGDDGARQVPLDRSWLDETGAPMKVQQELMRHASIQTTMNVYGQAMSS